MDGQLYPKIHDDGLSKACGPMIQTAGHGSTIQSDKINLMLDKQKILREKLTHYKKIKNKWSHANTVLKLGSISVSCVLAGASILTVAPFSIPLAAAISSEISLENITITNLIVERFTSRCRSILGKNVSMLKIT